MELRRLGISGRFEFEDKQTSLPLMGGEAGLYFPAKGTFKLLGVAQWGWMRLEYEKTGREIVVAAEVGLRHILPIL